MSPRMTDETLAQKFERVAEIRTNAVLDKLRLLGNCSNKRLYSYTEEQLDKIFSAINKQVRETRLKFNFKKKEKFKF